MIETDNSFYIQKFAFQNKATHSTILSASDGNVPVMKKNKKVAHPKLLKPAKANACSHSWVNVTQRPHVQNRQASLSAAEAHITKETVWFYTNR